MKPRPPAFSVAPPPGDVSLTCWSSGESWVDPVSRSAALRSSIRAAAASLTAAAADANVL